MSCEVGHKACTDKCVCVCVCMCVWKGTFPFLLQKESPDLSRQSPANGHASVTSSILVSYCSLEFGEESKSKSPNHWNQKCSLSSDSDFFLLSVFFPTCNALTCRSHQDLPSTIQPKGRQVGFVLFTMAALAHSHRSPLLHSAPKDLTYSYLTYMTSCPHPACVYSVFTSVLFPLEILAPLPRKRESKNPTYAVTSLMEFIVVSNSFSSCRVQPFACFSTRCINRCSSNALQAELWRPAVDTGSLLAPRLFALPQSFLVHDVCV